MQSRFESLVETCVNVFIGYCVSLAGQFVVFPALGIPVTFGEQILISVFFTVLSVARMYAIRRYFNLRLKTLSHTIATGLKHARH
ncbi:MAG: DUF7220 family protein [Cellvibrionaceae bacterium]